MKVVSSGNTYEIFDDSLKTYDKFPAQCYIVRFSKLKGFYLEEYNDIEIEEPKIYGAHTEKVQKVLSSFEKFNRNLGVILSGDKGIGKSLFAKMLAVEGIQRGIPLIVVDRFVPGIASYIENIDQEVIVLFDEFDKTFGDISVKDGETSPQVEMLGLFDGISAGKKLFVITCNKLQSLSEYLVNRPGRFHYHFRFDYPSAEEIRRYLTDKLREQYYREIDDVISFSRKINLNYDCLRAIAFEINTGTSFKEAIKDLNIVNLDVSCVYNIALHYENGMVAIARNVYLNVFGDTEETVWLSDKKASEYVYVTFNVSDIVFDSSKVQNIVVAENLDVGYHETDDEDYVEVIEAAKESKVMYMSLTKQLPKSIHYSL